MVVGISASIDKSIGLSSPLLSPLLQVGSFFLCFLISGSPSILSGFSDGGVTPGSGADFAGISFTLVPTTGRFSGGGGGSDTLPIDR